MYWDDYCRTHEGELNPAEVDRVVSYGADALAASFEEVEDLVEGFGSLSPEIQWGLALANYNGGLGANAESYPIQAINAMVASGETVDSWEQIEAYVASHPDYSQECSDSFYYAGDIMERLEGEEGAQGGMTP